MVDIEVDFGWKEDNDEGTDEGGGKTRRYLCTPGLQQNIVRSNCPTDLYLLQFRALSTMLNWHCQWYIDPSPRQTWHKQTERSPLLNSFTRNSTLACYKLQKLRFKILP